MEKTDKIKKLLLILIAVVAIGASMAFGYFIAKHPAEKKPSQPQEISSESTVVTEEQSTAHTEESTEKVTENTDTDSSLLLGAWTDNANFSGYEFFSDGTMKVTYFNMAALNLDDVIDGTYTGAYSVSGDRLSVSYTVYSKSIEKEYTFKVTENTLTLKSGGEEAIYVRKGAQTAMENVDKELLGKWSSNLSGFEFKDTGVVSITYIALGSIINGTVDGVYTLDGDELKIKYSIYTGVIEKTYKYSIEKNVLTLTEKGTGEKGTYIRKN